MKKTYVSGSPYSERMFKNDVLEKLSKIHYAVPLLIYIPLIGYLIYSSFQKHIVLSAFVFNFFFGFIVWTLTEYLLHRYIFHFEPSSKWGQRLHFIFHGVHHDYPNDAKRLVMPPSASIPLALLFYFLFSLFFTAPNILHAFYSGFIFGYLLYDMIHYAIHHHNFKSGPLKVIKKHHMLHHFSDSSKGYGVSSSIWDFIFQSGFRSRK